MLTSKYLVVGSVGDSRAFLFKKNGPGGMDGSAPLTPVELTKIHTPYDQAEAERIISRGGEVRPAVNSNGEESGPLRVWQGKSKLPGLMMTRSFGDKMGHQCGINTVPCRLRSETDVSSRDITDSDYAIVIASDGIWDMLSPEKVANILSANPGQSGSMLAKKLEQEALLLWDAVNCISHRKTRVTMTTSHVYV